MAWQLTFLDVCSLLVRVGRIATNHLRVLGDLDTLSLDNLDVVQTRENLMLHLELGAHGKLGTLLDLEGLVLQRVLAALLRKVDGDGVTAGGLHGQGLDDADTLIVRVRKILSSRQTERLLVPLQGLIVGICPMLAGVVMP